MLPNVFKSKDQLADKHYQKGAFRRAAELYRKAQRFRDEANCYVQLGEIDHAVEIYESQRLYQEAAELLSSHDKHRDASSFYEKAGSFRLAAEAARKVGLLPKAGRLYEDAKMFDEAATCFLQDGATDHAIRSLELKAEWLEEERRTSPSPGVEREIRKLNLRRADMLEKVGRHAEAARLLSGCGMLTRAAALFEKSGQHNSAARTYLAAGRFEQALAVVEAQPDQVEDELKAEIYLDCSKRGEAAEIFEAMGRFDAAASAYQDDGQLEQAARLWEKAESPALAAELFRDAGLPADAGRCYMAAGHFVAAAKAYLKAGLSTPAAKAYEQAGQPFMAGRYFAKSKQFADAARNLLAIERDPERPESRREYIHASLLLVPLLVEQDDLDEAEQRFAFLRQCGAKIPDPDRLYCQARIAEARGSFRQAEKYYQRIESARQGFQDVSSRLEEVRERASSEPLSVERLPDSEAFPQLIDGDDPTDVPSGVFEISGVIGLPAHKTESPELPFDMGQRIDPWWDGATFIEAKDRRGQGRPVLMALFPSASVGGRADDFRQAMLRASTLRHGTILQLDEVLHTRDKVVLVYEHFEAKTLDRWLGAGSPQPLVALNIIVQICEALSNAHQLGLIHQWISPRTVLIDDEHRVKLVGMGLRDILNEKHVGDLEVSPESRQGGIVGPAADVYGLGWLAVTLLNASLPADWRKTSSLDVSQVGWSPTVAEEVPQVIRDQLLRCLDQDPLRRPQTADLRSTLSSIGLVPGQVVADRYEILGDLGSGGMSRVYRARDQMIEEEVAIKTVLSPAFGRSNEDEQRLLREVQICRRITHPNVVRVHDIGKFPGGIFVTMEILEGESLEKVIEDSAPLAPQRVQTILLGIAAALGEAHNMSIVHRDLKPGNVIVNGDRVKVLDFGIARRNDATTAVNLTRTGEVIGSPLYMAPEQIQGKPLDGRCDLYALGVIAFTMLTGREPFHGDNPTSIVLQHINDPPPSIAELRPDLDASWVNLLECLLAKTPAERYANADKLSEALKMLAN